MYVINVDPIYCALLLKRTKGSVLKLLEGRCTNWTKDNMFVLVRCNLLSAKEARHIKNNAQTNPIKLILFMSLACYTELG